MDTTNTVENRSGTDRSAGILYPLMLIAAIAVIVFSVVGIATMMGWLPNVESKTDPAAKSAPATKSSASGTNRPRVAYSGTGACPDCGVVESIRAVESKGKGTGLGMLGGAVVGGILGNQVGRGDGRTAATVVGAGAGAYAGNEIEKNTSKTVAYQVRVRMNDGTYRTVRESAQPALAVGQKVRVTEQGIIAAG